MSLPEWVDDARDTVGPNRWTKALAIAWEALERIQDRSKRIMSGEVQTREFGAADYSEQVCATAMRRIEELGK